MQTTLPKGASRARWQTILPYVLLVCGLIGLLASFTLTYDKIHVLTNSAYRPSCNLNPVLSCSSVMKTSQASLLGVPNTVFGLIAFSMLTMLALAMIAGAQFKRWLWICAQLAATAGVVFMHYLFFQGVFRIHAICPWCFVVWMVTIPIFWGITIRNIREGAFPTKRRVLVRTMHVIDTYNKDLLVLWYLIIFGILLTKFWYYWSTLL